MSDHTGLPEGTCSCLRLPLAEGGDVAAASLLHALSVVVETHSGERHEGSYVGTCWAGLPSERERFVLIQTQQGPCLALPAASVRGVQLDRDGDLPDREAGPALVELGRAIRSAGAPWDSVRLAGSLDGTTDVIAVVTFVDHHCEPGPDPRPEETRSAIRPSINED